MSESLKWHFEPTVTLGTLFQILGLAVVLIVGWVKIQDEMASFQDWRTKQESLYEQQVNVIQQLQLQLATASTIQAETQRRLGVVEQFEGMGPKRK